MKFQSLPTGAKKALVQYFGFDCYDENFEKYSDKQDNKDWTEILNLADQLWGDKDYALKTLTSDEAKKFIMENSPDIADEYSFFDEYHNNYSSSYTPSYSDNSWPVLAMPSCGEALVDGWHRFHSYIKSGFNTIDLIMLDK